MKKIYIASCIIFCFLLNAKAAYRDTVDYWRVYYNGVKLRDYDLGYTSFKDAFNYTKIIFKLDSIKGEDSITVRYGSDTPCFDCTKYLAFYDGTNEVIIGKSTGLRSPVSFILKELINFRNRTGKNIFDIFYSEDPSESVHRKHIVFTIQLE